jgi:hypothetical protein
MKNMKFIAILLMLGVFFSCSEDDSDIDWSKIDLSNINDLYAQPLPVIKKCVEGKWKWYVQFGGDAGISYPKDTYVEYFDDHYVIKYYDGSQQKRYFTWKRYFADLLGHETYVMWDKERKDAGWYFVSIKNDSLVVCADPPPGSADIPSGFGFVRIK